MIDEVCGMEILLVWLQLGKNKIWTMVVFTPNQQGQILLVKEEKNEKAH